jgi:hypothetical protein
MKIYADSGINWVFPYAVEYEDDDIVLLKELPRVHKGDKPPTINKWIDLSRGSYVYIDNKKKLYEIVR